MNKIIFAILLSASTAICQTGEWKYIDGWVYVINTTNDPTAGGAIIQKKKENKEQKYSTINGERYVTTEEWKRITNYEPVEAKTCLTLDFDKGFVLTKGPEPTAGGLLQLGLVVCFFLHRFFRKKLA